MNVGRASDLCGAAFDWPLPLVYIYALVYHAPMGHVCVLGWLAFYLCSVARGFQPFVERRAPLGPRARSRVESS